MFKVLFYLVLPAILCFSSCTEEDDPGLAVPPSETINKILPLGASRVEGARPAFESYRYELWKQLVDGNWDFDFIGTAEDEANLYPIYSNQTSDTDHQGHGGYTSDELLEGIEVWVTMTGAPDIVLFSSPGGNDTLVNSSFEKAVENINAIIDILQTANPNVTILIEQMAPGRSDIMQPPLSNYFENMQEEVITIAVQQTTSTSQVIPVDMFTGFNDSFLADEVHYNEAGARFIADRFYSVLEGLLSN